MAQFRTHKTAVLIFANSAANEELSKGIPKSKGMFAALNKDVVSKVKKTALPYFLFDERSQIGADFGTRFTAAIQTVFEKGFDSIITVGNDTPELTSGAILNSFESLKKGETVIGPSFDGGVYLLGVHKKSFEATAFKKLPWQTCRLLSQIQSLLLKTGVVMQLPRLNDIDSVSDVKAIVHKVAPISKVLFVELLLLLGKKAIESTFYAIPASFKLLNSPYNKGSPFASFNF